MRSIEMNPVGSPPLTLLVGLAHYGPLQSEIIEPESGVYDFLISFAACFQQIASVCGCIITGF